jgi:hypothetical protein
MEWLFVAYLLLVPLCSVVGGVALVHVTRTRTRPHPSCRRCGENLTDALGTTTTCPGCGRHLALAGVWPVRVPRRPIGFRVGVVTVVLGVLTILFWLGYLAMNASTVH